MSTIGWDKLFEGQRKLDSFILDARGLGYADTSDERAMALAVEFYEMVNEMRVFKFWSQRGMDRDKVLGEYVDVLHFILSTAIERGLDLSGIGAGEPNPMQPRDLLVEAIRLGNSLKFNPSDGEFLDWVRSFVGFAAPLGFSWPQVEESYWGKWQVNFDRQNSNY